MSSHATSEGTSRYAQRFAGRAATGHFRSIPDPAAAIGAQGSGAQTSAEHPEDRAAVAAQRLTVSTLGIGTYLGEADAATDAAYTEAVIAAVESGFNVIDTAINYRLQRSERSIGAALAQLARSGYAREEILLCTKAGYLTPDGSMPADPSAYFRREFIETGILKAMRLQRAATRWRRNYLADQLERSFEKPGRGMCGRFLSAQPRNTTCGNSAGDFLARLGAAFCVAGNHGGRWKDSRLRNGDVERISGAAGIAGTPFFGGH